MRMGLKMNIAKTKVMVVDNTAINVDNVMTGNVQGYVYLGQHYSIKKITRTRRYNDESWQAGRHTHNTGISSYATLPSARRDKCTTPVCCQSWHMVHISGHWPNKHRTNLRPHIPKSKYAQQKHKYEDNANRTLFRRCYLCVSLRIMYAVETHSGIWKQLLQKTASGAFRNT